MRSSRLCGREVAGPGVGPVQPGFGDSSLRRHQGGLGGSATDGCVTSVPQFSRSGIWEWRSWVPWPLAFCELPQPGVTSGLGWGKIWLQADSGGYWWPQLAVGCRPPSVASGTCAQGHSQHASQLPSEGGREPVSKREKTRQKSQSSCSLITKGRHHFCRHLFVTSESPGLTHARGRSQAPHMGASGGRSSSSLPLTPHPQPLIAFSQVFNTPLPEVS